MAVNAVLLFLLALVLYSVGCGLYLTVQWAAWQRQGEKHKAWSRPLIVGWVTLTVGCLLVWLCQSQSGNLDALYALTFTVFCAALLTWPHAFSRYRDTVAALAELPRYDEPQEGVWPPPPINTPRP